MKTLTIRYWKFKSVTSILPEGQNEAYYKFTADAGDRVYVRSSYQNQYAGMKIETFDSGRMLIDKGDSAINFNTLYPFIYAKADGTRTAETFYVKVTRGSYPGNMYFTVSIEDRIKSGNGTFNFTGTAENSGNTIINPAGTDSSVITMDLTNNESIPKGAIVKSITTSGTQSPSQGTVTHKLMDDQTKTWHTAIAPSSSRGIYNIGLQDRLKAGQKWSFKYNTKASGRSTMRNVSATINYEYDVTDQF